jgi:hypothetical protein
LAWFDFAWAASLFLAQVLTGRRSQQRTSESNLAITLISIVFMHLLCNALRVYLGVMVVLLVGKADRGAVTLPLC